MTERTMRYRLNRMGYSLKKAMSSMGYPGYDIVDVQTNTIVTGGRFSMDLQDVEDWIKETDNEKAEE